jgi:hypothetical protein
MDRPEDSIFYTSTSIEHAEDAFQVGRCNPTTKTVRLVWNKKLEVVILEIPACCEAPQ